MTRQTANSPQEQESNKANLKALPPSAKLVAKAIEIEGPLTQGQLMTETLLPRRTVRYALTRLDESDLLQSRNSLIDARKKVYDVKSIE